MMTNSFFHIILGIVTRPGIQMLIWYYLGTVKIAKLGKIIIRTHRKLSRHIGIIADPLTGPRWVFLSCSVQGGML